MFGTVCTTNTVFKNNQKSLIECRKLSFLMIGNETFLEIFKLKGQKKRTEIEVSMLVEIKKRSERKRKSLVKKDR